MLKELQAHYLYHSFHNGKITISFADYEINTKEYVLLQKSLYHDDPDDEISKIHITYLDDDHAGYVDIEKLMIEHGSISITLNEKSAKDHRLPNEFVFYLAKNYPKLRELHDLIHQMFYNSRWKVGM